MLAKKFLAIPASSVSSERAWGDDLFPKKDADLATAM
jgi:hypothetical protein